MRKVRAAILAFTVGVGLLVSSTVANGAPPELALTYGESNISGLADGTVVFEAAGEEGNYWVPPSAQNEPDDQGGGQITTQSLILRDGVLVLFCGDPLKMHHVLEKFKSKHDKTIRLECGTKSGFGFNHINKSHPKSQWVKQMGGKGSWTEYQQYLIRAAVTNPSKVTSQANNKRCYHAPVKLYKMSNGKPKYWKTIEPSVIVSKNNKRVITAIPSTKGVC